MEKMKRSQIVVQAIALLIIAASLWGLLIAFGITIFDIRSLRTIFPQTSFAKFFFILRPKPLGAIVYAFLNLFFLTIGVLLFRRVNIARVIFLATQWIYIMFTCGLAAFIAVVGGGNADHQAFIQLTISHLKWLLTLLALPVFHLIFFTRKSVKAEFEKENT